MKNTIYNCFKKYLVLGKIVYVFLILSFFLIQKDADAAKTVQVQPVSEKQSIKRFLVKSSRLEEPSNTETVQQQKAGASFGAESKELPTVDSLQRRKRAYSLCETSEKIESSHKKHKSKKSDDGDLSESSEEDISKKDSISELSIGLLNASVKEFKEVFREWDEEHFHRKEIFEGQGWMVVETARVSEPPWAHAFNEYLTDEVRQTFSLGVGEYKKSGVILIKSTNASSHQERIFVFAFGRGRYLLKEAILEPQFGSHVVFNSFMNEVPPSISRHATFEPGENPVNRTAQYAKGIDLEEILSGNSLAIIRSLFIKKSRAQKRLSFTGSYVHAHGAYSISQFPNLCQDLLKLFSDERYKQQYEVIDNIQPISDKRFSEGLDQKLFAAIKEKDQKLHVAKPGLDDFEENVEPAYYRYQNNQTRYSTLEELMDALPEDMYLSKESFVRRFIHPFNIEDEPLRGWNIYKAFVFETDFEGEHYVLNSGKWFKVSSKFREELDQDVNSLFIKEREEDPDQLLNELLRPITQKDVEEAKKEGEKAVSGTPKIKLEQTYNRRVSNESGEKLLLLDCRKINVLAQRSEIEVCDLLSINHHLIHVKDAGSSSNLSHLWAQGCVSAECLIGEKTTCLKTRDKFVRAEFIVFLNTKGVKINESSSLGKLLLEFCQRTDFLMSSRDQVIQDRFIEYCRDSEELKDIFSSELAEELRKVIQRAQNIFDQAMPTTHSFRPTDYTIVYAFFSDKDPQGNISRYLPFFSRIMLKDTAQKLKKWGYKVLVKKIDKPKQSVDKPKKPIKEVKKKAPGASEKKKGTKGDFTKIQSAPGALDNTPLRSSGRKRLFINRKLDFGKSQTSLESAFDKVAQQSRQASLLSQSQVFLASVEQDSTQENERLMSHLYTNSDIQSAIEAAIASSRDQILKDTASFLIHGGFKFFRLSNSIITPAITGYAQELSPIDMTLQVLEHLFCSQLENLEEILIPFNPGGHWVVLQIKLQKGGIKVNYIDSLKHEDPSITESKILHNYKTMIPLKEFLEKRFSQEAEITIKNFRIQTDEKACGAITVENILDLFEGREPDSESLDSAQTWSLRTSQKDLMEASGFKLDFETSFGATLE